MGNQNTCMYVIEICTEGICAEGFVCLFPVDYRDVNSRSNTTLFFRWAPL